MQTTVRVHYDCGFTNYVTIRGDAPTLDWERGQEMVWHRGNVWVYSWPSDGQPHEIKFLINDKEWCIGYNFMVSSDGRHDLYPHFRSREGRLVLVHHFDTPIVIYLPPSYDENPFKHYPVIYCHDGQNLFDPSTAFGGQVWAVDKTINRLVDEGRMEEVIAVGIYNRGAARIHDFTPSHDPDFMGVGVGGGADDYLHLITDEIKPFIDTHYRTKPEREYTGLLGSSLGGLVSFYMTRERPDVFSKVGALSSSFWWNQRSLLERVMRRRRLLPVQIYLDAGCKDNTKETVEMFQVLVDIGHVPGQTIFCHIAKRHAHSERFWAQRVHMPLRFLFPPQGRHDPAQWPVDPALLQLQSV